MLIKFYKSRIY